MEFEKFVGGMPGHQNAINIFAGRWASRIPGAGLVSGEIDLFEGDTRPGQAAAVLGREGRLDGMSVLELGPLEGGHTYALERLGAEVTAVEGNAEAFMKCLVAKEILGMKSRFLLGNFIPLLDARQARYDMIFASGVLYHMSDPLRLLKLVADTADRALFWTHYHDDTLPNERRAERVVSQGVEATYHRVGNPSRVSDQRWWGGLDDSACWMDRDAILDACRRFGFTQVDVLSEQKPDGRTLAGMTFVCSR